jgi:DNA modification methylase
MGREFFGVELNPEYAAMANARIRSEGEGRTRTTDGNGRVSEQLVLGL